MTDLEAGTAVGSAFALPEIVRTVLCFCDDTQVLYQCSRVSRLWNTEAIPLMWHGATRRILHWDRVACHEARIFSDNLRCPSLCRLWQLSQIIDNARFKRYLEMIRIFSPGVNWGPTHHEEHSYAEGTCLSRLVDTGTLQACRPRAIWIHVGWDERAATRKVLMHLLSSQLRYLFLQNVEFTGDMQRAMIAAAVPLRYLRCGEPAAVNNAVEWLKFLQNAPALTHLSVEGPWDDPSGEVDLLLHLAQRPYLQMCKIYSGKNTNHRFQQRRHDFMNEDQPIFPSLLAWESQDAGSLMLETLIPRMQKLQSILVADWYQEEVDAHWHVLAKLAACRDLREVRIYRRAGRYDGGPQAEVDDLYQKLDILAANCPQMRGIFVEAMHQEDAWWEPRALGRLLSQWPHLETFKLGRYPRCHLSHDEMRDLPQKNPQLHCLEIAAQYDLLELETMPYGWYMDSLEGLTLFDFPYPQGRGPRTGWPYEILLSECFPNLVELRLINRPLDSRARTRWNKIERFLETKRQQRRNYRHQKWGLPFVQRQMVEQLLLEIASERMSGTAP